MRNPALLVALLMATLAFAGCTDSGDTEAPGAGTNSDPTAIEPEGLTADSIVPAPEWAIGDYFGHHVFFGSEDVQGTHINAIVVDQKSGDWILQSDEEESAKWEATWDFPMLGAISKTDLSTTAFTADWNLYDFPLQDGKTWTATFNPLFSGARELTMTATFSDAIKTVGQGTKEGFLITGVNADGDVELVTDYIPTIGWYSELTYFEPLTAAEDDFIIRVWGMGQGSDWEGTIVDADVISLVGGNSPCFAPLNADGTANQACTMPAETLQFTISDEAAELYGIVLVGALAGHSRLEINPTTLSEGGQAVAASSQGLEDFDFVFEFVEIGDPPGGDWTYYWSGAGFVTFGFAQLWEIQYTETAFSSA